MGGAVTGKKSVRGVWEAACSSMPEAVADRVFFSTDPRDRRYAVGVCGGCSVRAACLRMALDAERGTGVYDRHGVFGGLTPIERFRMQRDAS